MSATITLAMIVGNEEKYILRCLEAFEPAFDELALVRAVGSLEPDKTLELARNFCQDHGKTFPNLVFTNSIYPEWDHCDNFSGARNMSFKIAHGDFIFWADADDLITPEMARKIREYADSGKADIYEFPYDTKNDQIVMRERLIKRGIGKWIRPVHERLDFTESEKRKTTKARCHDVVFDHAPEGYKETSFQRNRKILRAALAQAWENLFYLQNDYFLRGEYDHARPLCEAALGFWQLQPTERYQTLTNLATMGREPEERRRWAMQALELCPWRREAPFFLALLALDDKDVRSAQAWTRFYSALPYPKDPPWNTRRSIYGWEGVHLGCEVQRLAGDDESATKNEEGLFQSAGALISLVHATRGRPKQCVETRHFWLSHANNPASVQHIFGVDHDDAATLKAVQQFRHAVSNPGGTTPAAYNAAAKLSTGKIIIAMSDDAYPVIGWDSLILRKFIGADAMQKEAVLAVNDGLRKDGLLCHQIMTRKRYEAQGHVFSEEYQSMYADNEFSHRAFRDGIVIDGRDILIEHRWEGPEADETYKHTNDPERYRKGLETFKARNPDAVEV